VVALGNGLTGGHDIADHGVQRFDDAGVGEGSLDLLAERVGVIDEEVRRKALGEFEWVGHIEQHFAGEIGLACLSECGDRPSARGGVDEQVSARCRAGKRRKAAVGEVPGLDGVGEVAHPVRTGPVQGCLHIASADGDVMTEIG
jgi:hypothetical protein